MILSRWVGDLLGGTVTVEVTRARGAIGVDRLRLGKDVGLVCYGALRLEYERGEMEDAYVEPSRGEVGDNLNTCLERLATNTLRRFRNAYNTCISGVSILTERKILTNDTRKRGIKTYTKYQSDRRVSKQQKSTHEEPQEPTHQPHPAPAGSDYDPQQAVQHAKQVHHQDKCSQH